MTQIGITKLLQATCRCLVDIIDVDIIPKLASLCSSNFHRVDFCALFQTRLQMVMISIMMENLKIKGAFTAQELHDGHKGKVSLLLHIMASFLTTYAITVM